MADSRYSKGSRRNVTLKPNTMSSHYSSRTCKVRACKVRKFNSETGFCIKHARSDFNYDDLYEKCRECSEMVTSVDYGVTCFKCEFWYHIKCVGISQDQYKCMIEDGSRDKPLFHWYCRFCKDKCIEAVTKIDLLENQTRNLASNLTKLNDRVDAIETKLSGKVKETVRSQLEQKFDIDKRKFNVILFNVPEPKQTTQSVWQNSEKKAEDNRFFCKMVNESLDMDIGDGSKFIRDSVRLGGIRLDGKSRLLRVTFLDMNTKREVLGKAKLLKGGKYNGIYINPDLTPEQRKVDADLRKTLKDRKENGETEIFIRRGRIETRKDEKFGKAEAKMTEGGPNINGGVLNNSKDHTVVNEDGLSMPDLAPRDETSDSESDKSEISIESISSADENEFENNVNEEIDQNRENIIESTEKIEFVNEEIVESDNNGKGIDGEIAVQKPSQSETEGLPVNQEEKTPVSVNSKNNDSAKANDVSIAKEVNSLVTDSQGSSMTPSTTNTSDRITRSQRGGGNDPI